MSRPVVKSNDTDMAVYDGYIIQTLSDIKEKMNNLRYYQSMFDHPFDGEEIRLIEQMYHVVSSMTDKWLDKASIYGAIIPPIMATERVRP